MDTDFINHEATSKVDSELKSAKVARPRKWIKQWVLQESALNNGKCYLYKWVTEEESKVPSRPTAKLNLELIAPPPPILVPAFPRPDANGVYPCSIEGCGKVFTDAGALRKHTNVHSEKQYICLFEGCGKKFVDSSKLKRHNLIHTGEKHFVCPFEGCGKAFSLDFNRRSHMRTHTGENYHTCPVADCAKRFAHENKLRSHMQSAHSEKSAQEASQSEPGADTGPSEKKEPSKPRAEKDNSVRTFLCPLEGCNKRYMHEYKLNLHLRKEHSQALGLDREKRAGEASAGAEKPEGAPEREEEQERVPVLLSQVQEFVAARAGEQGMAAGKRALEAGLEPAGKAARVSEEEQQTAESVDVTSLPDSQENPYLDGEGL